MIKAIAFDPGVTTGFATGEIFEDKANETTRNIENKQYGPMLVQTAQARMDHSDIYNYLGTYKPNYIICENFEFRRKARSGLILLSREFIGVVNLYVQLNPDCTLVMQQPGQVLNGHFSSAKLQKLGLYRKPINGVSQIHANEACMHLCYWYRFGSGSQYGKEMKLKES